MAHWYYKGRTTTPMDHPTEGSIVLTPRMRFEAPVSAVQHLIGANLVRRLPDPPVQVPVQTSAQVQTSVPVPEKVSPPAGEYKSEPVELLVDDSSSASEPDDVVASPAVSEVVEEAVEEESSKPEQQEKVSPKPHKRGRARRSRG